MCFDKNVSIAAFSIGIISGIVAIALKMPILGLLIICFSQMQFSEILIWQGHDTGNESLNRIGTSWGKWSLPSHNIAISIGILISYCKNLKDINYWVPLIISIIFYLTIVKGYYDCYDGPDTTPACDKSEKEDNRCNEHSARLEWPWPHEWYVYSFVISVILLFIFVRPVVPSALIAIFYFGITWIVSSSLGKHQTRGSYWCWSTAMLAPIVVILNWVFLKDVFKVTKFHS